MCQVMGRVYSAQPGAYLQFVEPAWDGECHRMTTDHHRNARVYFFRLDREPLFH